jgi:hypothetical protein
MGYDHSRVIDVIRQVQLEAGKYIKKVGRYVDDTRHADTQRCGQVVDLIQQDLLAQVMQTARSRLVSSVYDI